MDMVKLPSAQIPMGICTFIYPNGPVIEIIFKSTGVAIIGDGGVSL